MTYPPPAPTQAEATLPRRRRSWLPWLLVGVVVLVALLVWVGTSIANRAVDDALNPDPSAEASRSAQVTANQAIADDLNAQIRELEGVSAVGTTYIDEIGVSPTISVRLTVATEADLDPVTDQVLEIVWLSDVDPLDVISIEPSVLGAQTLGELQSYELLFGDDADQLEAEYGPRPV